MLESNFREYLRDELQLKESTIRSRIANCKRVEQYEGDMDNHFDSDQCLILIERLTYSTDDQNRKRQPKHKIPIDGDVRNGSATLKQAVSLYRDFRRACASGKYRAVAEHRSGNTGLPRAATASPAPARHRSGNTGHPQNAVTRRSSPPQRDGNVLWSGTMKNLEQMSETELLQTHGAVLDELLRRDVVKTRNNPIGDYTEWLVCQRLGLERQPNSKASFDAIDRNGIRYQIKGRRDSGTSVQFSPIRNLAEQGFDFAIAVVFDDDYYVRFAVKIPYGIVPSFAKYSGHINGHILTLTDKTINHPGVTDIRQHLL